MGERVSLAQFERWLLLYAAKIEEQEAYLTELDAAIGDADHGVNMQRGMTQVVRHAASGRSALAVAQPGGNALGSVPQSQCSSRLASTIPSPHRAAWQSYWQPSPDTRFPSSHCSPWTVSMMPLPHASVEVQSAEQPSSKNTFPSSQASPGSMWPFPQPRCRQCWSKQIPSASPGYWHADMPGR